MTKLTDSQVIILNAVGMEIMDFSAMGYGVRDYVNTLCNATRMEGTKRGLIPDYLFELPGDFKMGNAQ